MRMVRKKEWIVCVLGLLLFPWPARAQEANTGQAKAAEVIQAAIQALGGERYLSVKNYHSHGRYFAFTKDGKLFDRFWDWTVYDPIKSRFQLGEGKRQEVEIYNLELGKAWKLEGRYKVEEIGEEEIRRFEKLVSRNIDILLKKRWKEEGMHLYYYGPDDISGTGGHEAVDLLDSTNLSVVVYFDLQSHLPTRMETQITDGFGIRHKQETEFLNWHTIQGVHTPLRIDYFLDGQISQQFFLEGISYDAAIPPDYFLEPKVEKKKE